MTDPVTDRFCDFDAAWAETARPVRVKILGATYDLPSEPPAALFLQARRLQHDLGGDGDVPTETAVEMLRLLVGETPVDAWIGAGIGIRQLTDVFAWVMRQYSDVMGDDVGEAEAPPAGATGPPTSTPTLT